ncbi:MAG TPA: glycosyl transferase [Lactobacillus sp.]|nr:glycosyl transferase [Lactobacillus sp.]
MNILFCCDHSVEDGVLIATLSLLKHVKEPLHIYVLTMSVTSKKGHMMPVSNQMIDCIQHELVKVDPKSTVVKIDCTALFNQAPPQANMASRFTPYSMLRLYADLIPQLPDRILYLDADIVCRQSFSRFYHQDLTNTEFVGVLDHYGKWFFHHELKVYDYVNSGVLLLNLAYIRHTGLFKRARYLCETRQKFMPDQAALNKLSHTKRIAPERFNEQHRIQPDTVFQHFTTSFKFFPWVHTFTVKPWEVQRVRSELGLHDYDDVLGKYLKLKQQA